MKISTFSFRFFFIATGLYFLFAIAPDICFAQVIAPNKNSGRTVLNFNRDWKFCLGDVAGAQKKGIDDSKWESIGLPHSFSIPYFMSSDFYVGYGWYRKHFHIGHISDNRVSLDFEGVFQQAEVFVNGKDVGRHTGGYTGFNLDITNALKPGDNILSVRVNNVWKADVAPRAGEHTFSGGIYRDVRLVITAPVHFAPYGIFISTPKVSPVSATVNVQVELKNTKSVSARIRVRTTILDPARKRILAFEKYHTLQPNSTDTVTQSDPVVRNPKLWSPDHPYLYTAVTTVYEGAKKIDEERHAFGIRSIKWTADSGFFLNGKHLYLKGANVHQDHAGWGDAVTNTGFYRDVKMIRDAGFNFIRGSHYPHDPAFADACDKLGVLFWAENNFWGIGGSDSTPEGYWNASAYPTQTKDTAAFEASVRQELQEMIRINRNHPSIIVWSISNEPFFTAKHTIIPTRDLLKSLVGLVHRIDPTRPAAVGGAQRPLDSLRIDRIGDIAGYNGDGSSLAVFQDPGIANLVAEYGSTTADRPGKYEPGWGDLAKDNGEEKHAWRSGQAIWCGFDHGSIAGEALGKMGIIDYFRLPKRSWYWYRNAYKGIPPPVWPKAGVPAKLRLEADKKSALTDGTDDVKLIVTVLDANGIPISNSPDIDLRVVSGPGEFPTGSSIHFSAKSDIRVADGQAAIEYRSWFAGKSIVRATSPGLEPATVMVEFTGAYPYHKGTRETVEKPYVRFTGRRAPVQVQVFGPNNPTFASSSDKDHISGYAADGNETSSWKAERSDRNPWWILDTEKKLDVINIKVDFPTEAIYHYKIEISNDMKNWRLLADFSQNRKSEKVKELDVKNEEGRAIRIVFDRNDIAGLAEVKISGKVVD
ncbi:glycoside hydrolase family 2 protein [Mucilaginibacter sp. SJ]|uniref:glycoside hydrolase family 2 protein n=1 Tax=Mucilaginibacter sp. SJ TaxID=3029053 RepID=UPI0023A9D448|nr:glycoside hydrolase family 2 TIM barrel-domain containing protein [Mucilaginibacter sp. SJ]WEA00643.1 glycoside hydrolase family 2 TIM barrel-domain containing protein [Mucilaginibacter sp. SJ]